MTLCCISDVRVRAVEQCGVSLIHCCRSWRARDAMRRS